MSLTVNLPRKTPVAAGELGTTEGRLRYYLRSRLVEPPQKDSSGDFLWTDEDVERAREVLASRRRHGAA